MLWMKAKTKKGLQNFKMDISAEFSLAINLQTISMVSFASKFWDRPDIKTQIREYFLKRKTHFVNCVAWNEITSIALRELNSTNLPNSLSIKLKDTIVRMGQKIRDWTWHVTEVFRLDLIFAEKIYWTPYGTIDEIKIFCLYWEKGTDFNRRRNSYFRHPPIFSLACMYGQVKFIEEHEEEIDDYGTMASLLRYALKLIITKQESLDEIRGSLRAGFTHAFQFYWKELDEIERISNLSNFAEMTLKYHISSFMREKHCEIFLFLINQMSKKEREEFVKDNAPEIIRMFLPVWRYQELIFQIFDFDSSLAYIRPGPLLNFMLECNPKHYDNSTHVGVFKMLWERFSKFEKIEFCINRVQKLFLDGFDTSILNVILIDKDLKIKEIFTKSQRPEKLKKLVLFLKNEIFDTSAQTDIIDELSDALGYYGCTKLAESGRFDDIDRLTETLNSDKIKKIFKELSLNVLNNYIKNCQFSLADKFLNWISTSPKESYIIKSKIDTNSIVQQLITSRKIESAEKFLTWQFKTAEEIKIAKNGMKDFILEKFTETWQNFISSTVLHFADDFKCLMQFFKIFDFCIIPPDEMEAAKLKIKADIDYWLDQYLIRRYDLELAEFLMDWVYDDVEEKREIKRNYLNRPKKGALLCLGYLKEAGGRDQALLCSWLKLINNFEEFKKELFNLKTLPKWFSDFLDNVQMEMSFSVVAIR